jgi:hypothetical protein
VSYLTFLTLKYRQPAYPVIVRRTAAARAEPTATGAVSSLPAWALRALQGNSIAKLLFLNLNGCSFMSLRKHSYPSFILGRADPASHREAQLIQLIISPGPDLAQPLSTVQCIVHTLNSLYILPRSSMLLWVIARLRLARLQ